MGEEWNKWWCESVGRVRSGTSGGVRVWDG